MFLKPFAFLRFVDTLHITDAQKLSVTEAWAPLLEGALRGATDPGPAMLRWKQDWQSQLNEEYATLSCKKWQPGF